MKSRVWAGEWWTSGFKGLWPFDGPTFINFAYNLGLNVSKGLHLLLENVTDQRRSSFQPNFNRIDALYFLQRFHDVINAKDRKRIWDAHTYTVFTFLISSQNRSNSIISMFGIVQLYWEPAAFWLPVRLHAKSSLFRFFSSLHSFATSSV